MIIKVEHFENGLTQYNKPAFIRFAQRIFSENEKDSKILELPVTLDESKKYVEEYCHNFKIL